MERVRRVDGYGNEELAFRLEHELRPAGGERRARVLVSEDGGASWSLFQTTVYRRALPAALPARPRADWA